MLVIDRVVLKSIEQPNEIMRLSNERAPLIKKRQDRGDNGMHVLDMRETIGRGNDPRLAMRAGHFIGGLSAKVAIKGRNAARLRDLGGVGRLDSQDAMSAVLEVRQQGAVVRSDINDEVLRLEVHQLMCLFV